MLHIFYKKYFRMLQVKSVDDKWAEGKYCLKRSFKSLCKEYGMPTRIYIKEGKILGAYWKEKNKNNSKEFQCI